MSELSQSVGQMLCIGFEGQECGPELRSLLKEVRPGGIIFFQRNIASEEQFRRLIEEIREVLKHSLPFLAIDQEGGQVDRFRELLGPLPSAQKAAQAGLAFELGDLAGRQLAAFGLNVDFAPVVDLGSPESQSVLGTRTAGGTAEAVTEFAEQFLRGLQGWNVLGCLKHFPGLGGGRKDSHLAMPVISKHAGALWEEDLAPYRKLSSNPELMVMVAHAWYPELEKMLEPVGGAADIPVPATLSKNLVNHLLRKLIGFQGLILSDDLEMGGVLEGRSIEQAAIEAARAGSDLLLVCRDAENVSRVHRALALEAEKDSDFRHLVKAGVPRLRPVVWDASLSYSDLEVLRSDLRRFRETILSQLDRMKDESATVERD